MNRVEAREKCSSWERMFLEKSSMQDRDREAGLCLLACSKRYREAELPGLRVNEGQGWRERGRGTDGMAPCGLWCVP